MDFVNVMLGYEDRYQERGVIKPTECNQRNLKISTVRINLNLVIKHIWIQYKT